MAKLPSLTLGFLTRNVESIFERVCCIQYFDKGIHNNVSNDE